MQPRIKGKISHHYSHHKNLGVDSISVAVPRRFVRSVSLDLCFGMPICVIQPLFGALGWLFMGYGPALFWGGLVQRQNTN